MRWKGGLRGCLQPVPAHTSDHTDHLPGAFAANARILGTGAVSHSCGCFHDLWPDEQHLYHLAAFSGIALFIYGQARKTKRADSRN